MSAGGFSDPDPADDDDTDSDDQSGAGADPGDLPGFINGDPPEGIEDDAVGEALPGRLIGEGVSCENCIHKSVCAIYGNFQPPESNDGREMFPVEGLAVFCPEYTPEGDDPRMQRGDPLDR